MENQENLDKELIKELKNSAPIFSMVPDCVMQSPELAKHLSAFRTFTILNSYAGNAGVCWVSNKTVQEKYPDQTEKVVRDNLRILIDLGFIFRALNRKSKKGTQRFLVFCGNWQNYFEKCKKVGNLKEAAEVQSFFEKRPFEMCFKELSNIFYTSRRRAVDHQPMKVCSIEQNKKNIKETTVKKRQNFFSNQARKKIAAASFQNLSFEQKLSKNLSPEDSKRALAFWNTFDEAKQKRTRNPVAFLTAAIKENWDKEVVKSPSERGSEIRTASEMNREFALIVNDLIQPNQGLSTHIAKDYFEIYNGSWNQVFHFGESSVRFKTEISGRLEKMGIKIPKTLKTMKT